MKGNPSDTQSPAKTDEKYVAPASTSSATPEEKFFALKDSISGLMTKILIHCAISKKVEDQKKAAEGKDIPLSHEMVVLNRVNKCQAIFSAWKKAEDCGPDTHIDPTIAALIGLVNYIDTLSRISEKPFEYKKEILNKIQEIVDIFKKTHINFMKIVQREVYLYRAINYLVFGKITEDHLYDCLQNALAVKITDQNIPKAFTTHLELLNFALSLFRIGLTAYMARTDSSRSYHCNQYT